MRLSGMTTLSVLPVCLVLATSLPAGILVTRVPQGFQFVEAASVLVNAKDKVLNLGADPKVGDRLGKLASVHLGGALMPDAGSGVMAANEDVAVEYLLPEGTPKNAPGDAAAIWKSARIAYKKSANDKT